MNEPVKVGDRVVPTYINDEWESMYTNMEGVVSSIANNGWFYLMFNGKYEISIRPDWGDTYKVIKRGGDSAE